MVVGTHIIPRHASVLVRHRELPASAARDFRARLRLYRDGFVFSCDGMHSQSCRYSASALIALGDEPFEISVGSRIERCHAVVVRPLVQKTLHARDVPFICLDLSPNHSRYRAFHAMQGDGILVVKRADIAELLPEARSFHEGSLSCHRTSTMLHRCIDIVSRHLPAPPALDARVERVMAEVERSPASTWDQLGPLACLSRDRFSHLFTSQLGISLRLFAQTMKIHAAARYNGSGMNLTEIALAAGFSDAAHFSKVYSKAFGHPPQLAFHRSSVAVDALPARLMMQAQRFLAIDGDEA